MFRVLAEGGEHEVYGTARSNSACEYFDGKLKQQIVSGIDVENHDSLVRAYGAVRPQVVVNCIGLVKQHASAADPLQAVPINTLLPHRLASLCFATGSRLVHFSTDCVFSGAKGNYKETDFPDADDLYGRTKLLGEVDYPHSITLRTSIIGRELGSNRSLLGWFLSQKGPVKGFTRAVFSGLSTVELSRTVKDFVLPCPELRGVFHVASNPISKFDLLRLVAEVYGKKIEIIPDDKLIIDRSLNADYFHQAAGYNPPPWIAIIKRMHEFN